MKQFFITTTVFMMIFMTSTSNSKDRLELETTFIKGNKEMPQIIYVVPWKDLKDIKRDEQSLVLHSLFGELFSPVYTDVLDTISSQE